VNGTPRLVVFDCDGVLVDTERLTVGVEGRVLTELGNPHTPEQVVARWMGRSSATQLAELESEMGLERTRLFDQLTCEELHVTFERDLAPVEGVPALLDLPEAHGVATCVASSGTHDRMRRTLGITGLYDRFAGRIFSATEVAHGKPAPDLFLHAAAAMGVEPSRCAVVEDSVYGVRAGVAAGMSVHGFAGGLTDGDALAAAGARTFAHMADLAELLLPSPGGDG